jgi:5'-nucleotidase (lipoprotein e(P4) family)
MHLRSARMLAAALAATLWLAPATRAAEVPANDNLNATLWTQRSVEFKGTALAAFALARFRLEQALADKNWTGAPAEQTGAYQSLPPAVIIDIDETLMDNSLYQGWMVMNGTSFTPETWGKFVAAQVSIPIPGAVEFSQFAEAKGVKVFYISNRTAQEEESTRKNMERYGFPMGGNVDTFLTAREKPDWGSAKGTRRAHVTKDYRVLLNIGDNFGDFVDAFRGTEAERQKVFDDNKERWGREWIVVANPTYGSFESAPFKHDFKLGEAEKRAAKRGALQAWPGP